MKRGEQVGGASAVALDRTTCRVERHGLASEVIAHDASIGLID
jgi:hypothetical protein